MFAARAMCVRKLRVHSALSIDLAACKTLARVLALVQPDGWDRWEREGYGGPRDVISLSLRG